MNNHITVSPMPANLRQFLENKLLTKPGMCFNNCFLAVVNTLTSKILNIEYVLAWVTHPTDGIRTPHALIKGDSLYYDPTLEPQGLYKICAYELDKEFDNTELMLMVFERFGSLKVKAMVEGEIAWWPLCRTGPATYEFINAPSASRR